MIPNVNLRLPPACTHTGMCIHICYKKKKGKRKKPGAWHRQIPGSALPPPPNHASFWLGLYFSSRALAWHACVPGCTSSIASVLFSFKACHFCLELPRNCSYTDPPPPCPAVPLGTGKSWSFEKAPLEPEPDLKEVASYQGVERGRHLEIHQTLPQTRVNCDTLWPGF